MTEFKPGDTVQMVKPYVFRGDPYPFYHPGVGSIGTIEEVPTGDSYYGNSVSVCWHEVHNRIPEEGEESLDPHVVENPSPIYIDMDCIALEVPLSDTEIAETIQSIQDSASRHTLRA